VSKNVLITGFEPFGGDKINPSEMVARSLDGRMISGRSVMARILPVETRTLRERMEIALREADADIVIGLGQANGRKALALERVAINMLDFEHADNIGVTRKGDSIARGGPEARLSNVPFDRIVTAFHENGIPGYVSNSAGTFLCNQMLYETLALTERAIPPVIAGFVHLPFLPAQALALGSETTASMSLELMRKGVEILIETIVPWMEQRTPETGVLQEKKRQMWIPRGVKEVER
jgi:pyroglutamyl-peptidase